MNIAKIQAELVMSLVNKGGKGFRYSLVRREDREYVAVCIDEVAIYLIRQEDFKIDFQKWNTVPINLSFLTLQESKAEPAIRSGELRNAPELKSNVVKITNGENHAWLDEKRLKYFDKGHYFKIINRKTPVFIYEDEELVGCLLPVNVRGDTDGD